MHKIWFYKPELFSSDKPTSTSGSDTESEIDERVPQELSADQVDQGSDSDSRRLPIESLRARLAESEQSICDLQTRVKELEQSSDDSQTRVKESEQSICDLQTRVKELEQSSGDLQDRIRVVLDGVVANFTDLTGGLAGVITEFKRRRVDASANVSM